MECIWLRGGPATRCQIQVTEEGPIQGKQPGMGSQSSGRVRRAFTHWVARPGTLKHKWGEKGAPWRDMGVRAQDGEKHVQVQGHPRVGCGSPSRGKEGDHMGSGELVRYD